MPDITSALTATARLVALQTSGRDELELCRVTQDMILGELGQDYCRFYLLKGEQLELVCHQNSAAASAEDQKQIEKHLEEDALCSHAFQKVRRQEDLLANSRELPGLGRIHILPIRTENQVLGVLVAGALITPEKTAPDPRNALEALLEILAALLTASRLQRDAERSRMEAKRDLEHAKELAQATTEAQSLFLANMSHEIRTPMNGIVGISQLMTATPLDSEQRDFMRVIQTSCNALLRIVNDILDFSKIESGKLEMEQVPFDVHQAITDFVTLLRTQINQKQISVSCSIPEYFPRYLLGDPIRFRQIISNLCSNAIKFTDQGYIRIQLECEDGETVTPPASDQIIHFSIRVEDSGIGIDPSKLESIFREFKQADSSTTRQYGGTGLGLSIVQALTERMGGTVRVESSPGLGSTFLVDLALPVADAATPADQAYSPASAGGDDGTKKTSHQGTALLVEDDEVNRMVASRLLEKMGWQVTQAPNGHQALMSMQQSEFDLIVMDCQMPVMDGFETSRRIRHELGLKTIPIIALTADASKDTEYRCKLSGMNAFLTKPVTRDLLESAIQRHQKSPG